MTVLSQILNGSGLKDVRDTINRTLLRVYDVSLYGTAAGDGTDATAAIDAAVAALTTAGGGTLFFPPGAYLYTKPRIRFTTSNSWISGPGATVLFNCVAYGGSNANWTGRVLFDGGYSSGTIGNVGVIGAGLTLQDTSGHDFSTDTPNDPLGTDPDSSAVCLLVMRGCQDWMVDGGRYIAAAGWTSRFSRCSHGIIRNPIIRDAIADGIHFDYGSTDCGVYGYDIRNIGDDALAVGFSGPACSRIFFGAGVIRDVGGKAAAVYGANSGKTDEINFTDLDVDSTFMSGIAVSALGFNAVSSTAPGGYTIKAGPIGSVRIKGGSIRNAGMRPLNTNSRAQDQSHGVFLQPSGSTIDAVEVSNVTIAKYRNAAGFVQGSGLARLLWRGVDANVQSAVGAAGSVTTSAGGKNQTPDTTAVLNITAATTLLQMGCTQDGAKLADVPASNTTTTTTTAATIADTFDRADVAPATGALGTTTTGGKTWTGDPAGISGNKAYFSSANAYYGEYVDFGASDVDVKCDITLNGSPARLVARYNGTAVLFMLINPNGSGSLIYYDGTNQYGIGSGFTWAGDTAAHTYELIVKANVATLKVDGTQKLSGSPSVTMALGTKVGFQDGGGTGGTARYDNFSVSAAA